jgi:hypothetical protein
MKLKTLKPLYLGGVTLTEGSPFETLEQHGRELIRKGYAEADSSDDEPIVTLDDEGAAPGLALTSDSLASAPKPEKPKKPAKGE